MNNEIFAVVTVFSGLVALSTLMVFWCVIKICYRRAVMIAALAGALGCAVMLNSAQSDQVKGYAFADAHGYILVSASDVADAKTFGKTLADEAAKHAKKNPGDSLNAAKLKDYCAREGLMRYPENRRVADWFAVQAAKAFEAEYEKRTK